MKKPLKSIRVTADREGGIPMSDEMLKAMPCEIGDPYACWKEGDGWRLVFPKAKKYKGKIPKDAHWGKVEPALPEIQSALPKKSTLDWKSIVLTTGLWPRTLVIPQRAKIPPGSKSLLGLCTEDEKWDYELLRGPNGRAYYLRVWLWDYKGEKFDENFTAPAARLTPQEAFRFAVANLVPREILEDCPAQWIGAVIPKAASANSIVRRKPPAT